MLIEWYRRIDDDCSTFGLYCTYTCSFSCIQKKKGKKFLNISCTGVECNGRDLTYISSILKGCINAMRTINNITNRLIN